MGDHIRGVRREAAAPGGLGEANAESNAFGAPTPPPYSPVPSTIPLPHRAWPEDFEEELAWVSTPASPHGCSWCVSFPLKERVLEARRTEVTRAEGEGSEACGFSACSLGVFSSPVVQWLPLRSYFSSEATPLAVVGEAGPSSSGRPRKGSGDYLRTRRGVVSCKWAVPELDLRLAVTVYLFSNAERRMVVSVAPLSSCCGEVLVDSPAGEEGGGTLRCEACRGVVGRDPLMRRSLVLRRLTLTTFASLATLAPDQPVAEWVRPWLAHLHPFQQILQAQPLAQALMVEVTRLLRGLAPARSAPAEVFAEEGVKALVSTGEVLALLREKGVGELTRGGRAVGPGLSFSLSPPAPVGAR